MFITLSRAAKIVKNR